MTVKNTKNAVVAFLLAFAVLFSLASCTAQQTSAYEKLSSDTKLLISDMIDSGVLNEADYVGIKSYQGSDYLVVYTVVGQSERAQTIDHEFYHLGSSYVGSRVSGTQVTMLETTLLGSFHKVNWNNFASKEEKQKTLAKLFTE